MTNVDDPVVTQSVLDATLKREFAAFELKVDAKINQAVEDLCQVIADFAERVDERFNEQDRRYDQKFEALFTRMDASDLRHEQLLARMDARDAKSDAKFDAFMSRIYDLETDNMARDAHIMRLDKNLHKVARKTGVKLS